MSQPKDRRAREQRNAVMQRLNAIAADAVEVLAARVEALKNDPKADPEQIAKLVERLMDVSISISMHARFSRAIADNPSLAQHAPSGAMAKRVAGLAARTRKASKPDRRTGKAKAEEEDAPGVQLPPWERVKAQLIKNGQMKPDDPMPQDDDPDLDKPKPEQPGEASGQ
jgi:hypothetical protein